MSKNSDTNYKASIVDAAAILPTGNAAAHKKKKEKVTELQPVVSKAVLRKLAKIAREKESKKHRLASLEILQDHQFDGDKRVLLEQSGLLGSERSHKEELARLYALKQQGIALSAHESELLSNALLEHGDIENANRYIDQQRGTKLSSHAHKSMTSNPFMPLSTASATITATIQERLLTANHDGKNINKGERKIYTKKELAKIADNIQVTEFDSAYQKKIKRRQRREEHLIVDEKLKLLNSKKVHEMSSGDEDGDAFNPNAGSLNPDKLMVLPKELQGLSEALNAVSGGKMNVMTSQVSHAQMGRGQKNALLSANSAATAAGTTPAKNVDDGLLAAASLISKGLLTTKNKNKIDDLFSVAMFSDSDDDNAEDGHELNAEEEMWGVTAKPTKAQKDAAKKQKEITDKAKNKKANAMLDDDEFVSAAAAVTGGTTKKTTTNDADLDPLEALKRTQEELNRKDDAEEFDEFGNKIYKSYVPQGLAMPTVTRTSQAAEIMKTMPIAVMPQPVVVAPTQGTNPIVIHKRQKGNKAQQDAASQQKVQLTVPAVPNVDLARLQKAEDEYKVNFNVLKVRDVLDYLETVEKVNKGIALSESDDDLDDEARMDKYSRFQILQQKDEEEEEKPKKRKVLFDFSKPITVPAVAPTPAAPVAEEKENVVVEQQQQQKKKTKAKKAKADATTTTTTNDDTQSKTQDNRMDDEEDTAVVVQKVESKPTPAPTATKKKVVAAQTKTTTTQQQSQTKQQKEPESITVKPLKTAVAVAPAKTTTTPTTTTPAPATKRKAKKEAQVDDEEEFVSAAGAAKAKAAVVPPQEPAAVEPTPVVEAKKATTKKTVTKPTPSSQTTTTTAKKTVVNKKK